VGPVRNGGIGTAFTALAKQLSLWGHSVTIVYTLGSHTESGSVTHWVRHYANLGITFVPLNTSLKEYPRLNGSHLSTISWRIHEWLQGEETQFDIAFFPEWTGPAYYALLAKGQGLAYRHLLFVVNTHGPESWAHQGNDWLPNNLDIIERDYMERECVSRADWVISPSEYMLRWMARSQWGFTEKHRVIQNLIAEPPSSQPNVAGDPCNVLTFFGRLEPRKGLLIFCEALDVLDPALRMRLTSIQFLGKALRGSKDLRAYIRGKARAWGVPVSIQTDRDHNAAIKELSRPGVLAVIPSLRENSPYTVLECLHHGIPFVASAVGGIPELIHSDDHARTLFSPNPQSLSALIARSIRGGLSPARMARTGARTIEEWRMWLDQAAVSTSQDKDLVSPSTPLVSLCLCQKGSLEGMVETIASVFHQTYRPIELLVFHDERLLPEVESLFSHEQAEQGGLDWRFISHPTGATPTSRRTMTEEACGEYLLFLEGGDIATPDMLTRFVMASQTGGAQALSSVVALHSTTTAAGSPEELLIPIGGSSGVGVFRNTFGDSNTFWRRAALLSLSRDQTEYVADETDWQLLARACLSRIKMEVVPETLFWRSRDTQTSRHKHPNDPASTRNLRPYFEADPAGLGMVVGYARFLHESAMSPGTVRSQVWRAASRLFYLVRAGLTNKQLRGRAVSLLRQSGWRHLIWRIRQAVRDG
jgi:glycosyltransferase involved in cell wall biosynthesis